LTRLSDAKTLGGVGSILLLIPGVSIVGYVLVLVAAKYVSDELGDRSIFNNMIYAVIAGIAGGVTGVLLIVTGAVAGILTFGIGALLGVAGGLVIFWVALVMSAIFIRRALDAMANGLGVGTFRTAGTLYLVGAALAIVLVGLVVLFVAAILLIIAFFSIKEIQQPAQTQPPMPSMVQPGKFCPSCGTQMASSAVFCPKCGAKQPM